MKKHKKSPLQNRTRGFHIGAEKPGSKKKLKGKDVSRFISEGNPNTQAVNNSERENEGQGFQHSGQQDDPS